MIHMNLLMRNKHKKKGLDTQKKILFMQVLLVTIIIWTVWLPLCTSGNIRMDSERMIFHSEEALSQYLDEGRFGLVVLLHLFGLTAWNPTFSGILFLCFFTLTTWILSYFIFRFIGNSKPFPWVLFALLFATSPIWAFHIYFVLQIAAVGFGMMLTAFLAGLDMLHHTSERKLSLSGVIYAIISTLLLAFSLSIYQGLIVFYLTAAALFVFCQLLNNHQYKLSSIIAWMVHILISLAAYLVIVRMIRGGPSAYLAQQIQWGQLPLFQCVMNIAIQFGKMLLQVNSGSVSLYPLAIILFVILMYRRWKAAPDQKVQNVLILLAGSVILLLPLAMSVLQGSRPVPRTQFALQLTAAFFPACYLVCSKGKHVWLRILCILAICLQVILNIRLLHTDNMRNQQDMQAIQTISASLEDTQVENKPLIFLGALPFQEDSLLMEKTDVYGRSFFEWIYDAHVPGSATSSAVRLLRAYNDRNYTGNAGNTLIQEACALAENMPSFPDDGYWMETEEYILVKLSE